MQCYGLSTEAHFQCKSIDWLLYDRNLRHERVKILPNIYHGAFTIFVNKLHHRRLIGFFVRLWSGLYMLNLYMLNWWLIIISIIAINNWKNLPSLSVTVITHMYSWKYIFVIFNWFRQNCFYRDYLIFKEKQGAAKFEKYLQTPGSVFVVQIFSALPTAITHLFQIVQQNHFFREALPYFSHESVIYVLCLILFLVNISS